MSDILKIAKNPIFYLIIILVLGFMVRLYKIENPIADWHSWRQADTAAVSRNFYQDSFNPFLPKYDDMSIVSEVNQFNPQTYRFVEFPIYNSLVYFGYVFNQGVDERIARIINIIFSLGSTIFLYLISKKYLGKSGGLIAAFIFTFLPFNIYFSRVILPEPSLVFFSLGMFYFANKFICEGDDKSHFTEKWIRINQRSNYYLSIIFGILAFLTKPMSVFYLLPIIYVYYQREGRFFPVKKRYIYWILIVSLPFVLWRFWMSVFPEGIPASSWLFNGDGIRLKPSFWRVLLVDRLSKEILTISGMLLFFIGFLIKPKPREGWIMHLLLLSAFLYLIIFATGNVRHDYYQVMIVPILSIIAARGFLLLVGGLNDFLPRIVTIPIGLFLLLSMLYFGWWEVKGLYQINNPVIVEAGREADKLLPKNAIVAAPYNGDSAFLYQINRKGWPVMSLPIEELVQRFKVTHFVSTARDSDTAYILNKYTTLFDNGKYFIVDVTSVNDKYLESRNKPF